MGKSGFALFYLAVVELEDSLRNYMKITFKR